MQVKIVDMDPTDWIMAVSTARGFLKEYPDRRLGIYSCVVYWNPQAPDKESFIVYKTKTSIVVRGSKAKD